MQTMQGCITKAAVSVLKRWHYRIVGMLTPSAKRSMGGNSAINLYRMLIRQPATGGYAGIDTQHGE